MILDGGRIHHRNEDALFSLSGQGAKRSGEI
jgi:hypothetical protein